MKMGKLSESSPFTKIAIIKRIKFERVYWWRMAIIRCLFRGFSIKIVLIVTIYFFYGITNVVVVHCVTFYTLEKQKVTAKLKAST